MMERSLVQEQAYWDERIGEAMREVQKTRELNEEYGKVANRLYEVEPISPTAGLVQREVIQFCVGQQREIMAQINVLQDKVEKLKAGRP